jgi:subtilisin family serine protease
MWTKQQPLPECTCGLHRGTEIFAAGGNTTSTSPIFPAAYRFVRGVGATTCDKEKDLYGKQIVWVDGDPVGALERCWISDVAPGADLVGLSGNGDQLVRWSGSSFASAVAAASYAGDSTNRRVEQLVTWWMTNDGECDASLPHTTAAMFDHHE